MDPEETDEPRSPGRPRLDRRTIAICVAIAAIAAVISAIVASDRLTDDPPVAQAARTTERPAGGDEPSGTEEPTPTPTLTPAEQVPDTAFTRFDDSALTMSDFRGQKIVVNFFASTCVPCRKEMPALQRVHQRLGDEVTFLGVAVQDDPEAALELVERTGVTYDLGQDPTGDLFQGFGATFLPTTAFVAEDGTVMELHLGELTEQEITEKISSNLLAGG